MIIKKHQLRYRLFDVFKSGMLHGKDITDNTSELCTEKNIKISNLSYSKNSKLKLTI